jgi:hypothetical protein
MLPAMGAYGRGCSSSAFATDALEGGGAARVPMRLHAIVVALTLTDT